MTDVEFIEACAQALHREHGRRASTIVAAQIRTLQSCNPVAAGNWRKIAQHLPSEPATDGNRQPNVASALPLRSA